MHLQAVVPFMQLTWNNNPNDCQYTVETVVPMTTRYHLVNENLESTASGQEINLTFYFSDGYTPDPAFEGISHVMRKFEFGGFPPPANAGNLSATVTITVFDRPFDPADPNPSPSGALYKKKSKMRLEEADAGVDPTVNY